MMDYEKKYKEALNDMRAIYPNLKGDAKLAVEHAFPELRESEDERIRKKLYHTVLGTPNNSTWFDGTSKEAMLAWLEKQKESHIPWYDYQKSKEAGYTIVPNEEYEQLIKQKEQKPAWSEEDERIVGRIQMILEFFDRNYPADMNIGSEIPKYISWLKSLRPSWKPSEEQMEALEKAIVRSCSHQYGVPLSELYEQLKKL